MSAEYGYKFFPGPIERTREEWKEFVAKQSYGLQGEDFVPALGGCFIVLNEAPEVSRLTPWRPRSADAVLDDYGNWLRQRRPRLSDCGSVMVVDDDQSLVKLLTISLESQGYSVAGYGDARVALLALQEAKPPDVIVVDLKMPGMDGHQFLQQVHDRGIESRVVIASGHMVRTEAELGADASLSKPFAPEDLFAVVKGLAGGPAPDAVA